MRLEEAFLIVLLSFWLVISFFGQFKTGLVSRLRGQDVFHLIPNWRFFAPVPARRDYHLEYRTFSRGGAPTRYVRVEFLRQRDWLSTIWNPSKRRRKAFNTSVRRIMRCRIRFDEQASRRCVAYLHLLNYLQSTTFDANAYALQFRIIASSDYADDTRVRLAFLSDWHEIAR
jgi:hypothetical protein